MTIPSNFNPLVPHSLDLSIDTRESSLELYKCWAVTWVPHDVKNGIVTFKFNSAAKPQFPAVEGFPRLVFHTHNHGIAMNPDPDTGFIFMNSEGTISFSDNEDANTLLTELGFTARKDKNGDVFLSVPIPSLLQEKWNELKEQNNLPDLNIHFSKGISTDEDFIQANIGGKIVISEDKEALHDLITHIVPIICLMKAMGKANWNREREFRMDFIKSLYDKINNCTDLTCDKVLLFKQIGIFIDILTADAGLKLIDYPSLASPNDDTKRDVMNDRIDFLIEWTSYPLKNYEDWVDYILRELPNTFKIPKLPTYQVIEGKLVRKSKALIIMLKIASEWEKASPST